MRKFALLCAILVGFSISTAPRLYAQEPAQAEHSDAEGDSMKWKLINTGIFALLVGYAAIVYGPRFFQARSLDIQKAIKDATGLKIEADFRHSEIDKKMSNLSGEVARMKGEAAAEIEREHQRLLKETAQEVDHIGRNTEAEIDAMRAGGSLQVKHHTAQLALALAERRLQAHFSQANSRNSVGEFVSLVGSGEKR